MGGQGGGPRRGARRHTRAVRFAGRPLDNSESQTGLPYLATTSETERRARCAAAPRSEFRACEREHAPSFDDDRLDGIPLSPPPAPLRLPWLPRPPQQRPASPHAPACPTILDMIPSEEARAKAELWFQNALDDLTSIRDHNWRRGSPRPTSTAAAARPLPSVRPRRQSGLVTECGTVGISAASSATSTSRRTPTSTSATLKAGSVITRTNTWPPTSLKASGSMLMSSCSPSGYPISPRCPSGTHPWGRNSGASARWGGTYEFYSSLPSRSPRAALTSPHLAAYCAAQRLPATALHRARPGGFGASRAAALRRVNCRFGGGAGFTPKRCVTRSPRLRCGTIAISPGVSAAAPATTAQEHRLIARLSFGFRALASRTQTATALCAAL